MKVHGLKCRSCGDIIYSRAPHDLHYCSCGNFFVDGGQENDGYRYGWSNIYENSFELVSLEIDVTKTELYSDWNNDINKYGWIYGKDTPKRKKFVAKRFLKQ